jgi:hypothetical protein
MNNKKEVSKKFFFGKKNQKASVPLRAGEATFASQQFFVQKKRYFLAF